MFNTDTFSEEASRSQTPHEHDHQVIPSIYVAAAEMSDFEALHAKIDHLRYVLILKEREDYTGQTMLVMEIKTLEQKVVADIERRLEWEKMNKSLEDVIGGRRFEK